MFAQEAATQHNDPRELRKRLHFASPEQRRERVAQTFIGGCYSPPREVSFRTTLDTVGVQTEQLYQRDAAVGPGVDSLGPPDRVVELDTKLPHPQDFPILTIAQLVDAEQRLKQLTALLETAIIAASQEEEDQRRMARIQSGLDADGVELDANGRPIVASSFLSTDEWMVRFGSKVESRLRVIHRDPEGVRLPTMWSREKIDRVTSPSPSRNRSASVGGGQRDMATSPNASFLGLSGSLSLPPSAYSPAPSSQLGSSRHGPTAEELLAEIRAASAQPGAARLLHSSGVGPGSGTGTTHHSKAKTNKWANFDSSIFNPQVRNPGTGGSGSGPNSASLAKPSTSASPSRTPASAYTAAQDAIPSSPQSPTKKSNRVNFQS